MLAEAGYAQARCASQNRLETFGFVPKRSEVKHRNLAALLV
jgi:hypothetical protein